MKKINQLFLPFFLALILVLGMFPAQAAAKEPAANIVTYIPQGETNPHTIHWLRGITPPTMPGQTVDGQFLTPSQSDMKLIDGLGNILDKPRTEKYDSKSYEEYYVSTYLPGNGWYDLNKANESAGIDANLCFAMASGNMLHWWFQQNKSHIDLYQQTLPEDASRLLEDYQENLSAVRQNPTTSLIYTNMIRPKYGWGGGGMPDLPIDYLLNGYPAFRESGRNIPARHSGVPAHGGGLFYDVFGKSILTDRLDWYDVCSYDYLDKNLKFYMDQGIAVSLGYTFMYASHHAVTLWGAEYDKNGKLCALYITDNNDSGLNGANHFGPDESLISMIRYPCYNDQGRLKISTIKDAKTHHFGSQISGCYLLTLGEEGWLAYEETGKPMYSDGRAFLSPIIPNEYTITLNANGGTVDPDSLLTQNGELPELPTPERSGYDFLGWFNRLSGGIKVMPGDAVTIDMTLYAHWEKSSAVPAPPDPTDPEPTDPEPNDPEPTDPEPTDPEPTDPEPADPEPTDPEPTDPEPTDPEPTDPEPTDPEPTDPEPTDPEPTDPEPTEPHMHVFGPWTVLKEPTSQEEGIEERFCSCGQRETRQIPKLVNPFQDVPSDRYFTEPVVWAVNHGITQGTSESMFSPDNICTRGQIVTFLWRNAGHPAAETSQSPFEDIHLSDYCYKPVLWAVENKITRGISAHTFGPQNSCTRAQAVTFLWRAAGCPEPQNQNCFFADVDSNAYYRKAVLWAAENSIALGIAPNRFAPDVSCTRGQIVTFLYRSMH